MRRQHNESDIVGLLWSIGLFIALWFSGLYFANKKEFWREMNSYVFPAIVAFVLAIITYTLILFLRNRRLLHKSEMERQRQIQATEEARQKGIQAHEIEKRRIENIFQKISETGFDANVSNFIDRFGKEGRIDAWEYRGYTFDPKRLEDFCENIVQNNINILTSDLRDLYIILQYFIDKKEKDFLNAGVQTKTLHHLSELSKRGDDLENLIVRLYDAIGYVSKRIGGHGDQGGDVVASKDGENVLIQAKCYQGTVGNAAVQQAAAARLHYGCTRSVVITTSSFTSEAVALAKSNSVELIDGKLLKQRLLEYLGEMWQ